MPISFADAIFWVAVAFCAVAQGAIIRSALQARRKRAANQDVPAPQPIVELVWAVAPAFALIGVFIATWRAIHS